MARRPRRNHTPVFKSQADLLIGFDQQSTSVHCLRVGRQASCFSINLHNKSGEFENAELCVALYEPGGNISTGTAAKPWNVLPRLGKNAVQPALQGCVIMRC